MACDSVTAHAIAILRRHVKSSPDRKARHALEHLLQRIPDGADVIRTHGSRALVTSSRAVEDNEDDELPTVDPSPREMGVFFRACRAALAHGLTLQPDTRFRWFDPVDPAAGAEVIGFALMVDAEDPAVVYLQRGLSDFDLFRTTVHELFHVHDHVALGTEGYRALEKAERERRAREFEAAVMLAEGQGLL